jgi:large subunit ribosomal protein L20
MLKSLWYATRDRRVRKRDLRKLWIARINAAARLNGTTYSKLVAALKKANIDLNRKMLADIAVREPATFAAVVAKTR